jgi:hypothetical protein
MKMSAFNTIVILSQCPACGQVANVKCQTHVASLYAENLSGIIEPREYALGESLVAKAVHSRRVAEWLLNVRGEQFSECCYADCEMCHAALFAVIDFSELTPVAVRRVGLEAQWPVEFPK